MGGCAGPFSVSFSDPLKLFIRLFVSSIHVEANLDFKLVRCLDKSGNAERK